MRIAQPHRARTRAADRVPGRRRSATLGTPLPRLPIPMPARPALSACIITFNEADRIDACLDSLAFCDEIVVVDSGSTDRPRELAAAR